MIKVTSLHIYPLKGARGIPLTAMPLDRIGPVHDRRWMVVDPDGTLVTQREIGRLCLVGATPHTDRLILDFPGTEPLVVPIDPDSARRPVRIWNDTVEAADQGDAAAHWLSTALGADLRLVWFPNDVDRRTDPDYDPLGSVVGFADGYPILVAGEESLADLNRRLEAPVPMDRFRPNIVIQGAGAFAEDGWRRMTIGPISLDLVKPCARCPVPTVDQTTGHRSAEPLRTMATFRKRGSAVMFGMNAVHRSLGAITVGDPVAVVARD